MRHNLSFSKIMFWYTVIMGVLQETFLKLPNTEVSLFVIMGFVGALAYHSIFEAES